LDQCEEPIQVNQTNESANKSNKISNKISNKNSLGILSTLGQKRKAESNEPITIDLDDQENTSPSSSLPPLKQHQSSPLSSSSNQIYKNSSKPMDKETEIKFLKNQLSQPLSERLRPKTIDEYVGQEHLIGTNGILRGFIENDLIPSFILWGPPGVGKTTIARIISKSTRQKFIELNATNSGINELRKIFENCSKEFFLTKRKTIIFCDEIHRYNKSQQDFFLPFVEKGDVILIGATTENPSFQLNNALLSRCKIFTLKKLEINQIHKILNKGILHINKIRRLILNKPLLKFNKESIDYISDLSNGDSRISINLLELIDSHYNKSNNNENDDENDGSKNSISITVENLRSILQKTHLVYDRIGDSHYDTISAFHKSIRGNDADATLWYLGKMIHGGENPLYIARRMIRIASEDIGILDDSCLPFAISTYQAVTYVGLPEADLSLVHCAIKLAKAPKSVEIYRAWNKVKKIYQNETTLSNAPIPLHLRNAPTNLMKELNYGKEYKYNPNYKDGKVVQEYKPKELGDLKFLDGKHLGDIIDPDLSNSSN